VLRYQRMVFKDVELVVYFLINSRTNGFNGGVKVGFHDDKL